MKQLVVVCLVLFLLSCSDDEVTTQPFRGELTKMIQFGGSEFESLRAVIGTADGGFAAIGVSESTDGDFSFKNRPGADYFLVKFDRYFEMEWQKTYGGSGDDQAHDLVQTNDGGFALIGYSQSADGDGSNNEGFHDNWIVKVDANGGFEWEQSFGFSGHDHAYSILAYDDGYAIGGFLDVTASGGLGSTHGVGEFWIHRLNLDGSIRWRKYFGGTHDDKIQGLAKTEDGGMILAGYTESNDFDVSETNGSYEFWAVKVDDQGQMVWEKTYGGAELDWCFSVAECGNDEFVLAGYSTSTDGDITSNIGNADMWIVKIDGQGNIIWDKNYGGTQYDSALEVSSAFDNGFWIAGHTRSTDQDVTENFGENDGLLLQVSDLGAVEFSKTIGGTGFDFINDVKQIQENVVVFVGESDSSDGVFATNEGNKDAFIGILQ